MYWSFGAQIVSFLGLVILLFYLFIISMTKLLDADWLRGVQLFHKLYCSAINDFPKQAKWRKGVLNYRYRRSPISMF